MEFLDRESRVFSLGISPNTTTTFAMAVRVLRLDETFLRHRFVGYAAFCLIFFGDMLYLAHIFLIFDAFGFYELAFCLGGLAKVNRKFVISIRHSANLEPIVANLFG